jgi:hypothetical protein
MTDRFYRNTKFSKTLSGTYQTEGYVEVQERGKLALLIDYTKGNEDTLRIKIEFSDDGNTWFQETAETIAAGVATVTQIERELTGSQKSRMLFNISAEYFRVWVKGTGVDPTGGTVKVRYKLE